MSRPRCRACLIAQNPPPKPEFPYLAGILDMASRIDPEFCEPHAGLVEKYVVNWKEKFGNPPKKEPEIVN